MPFPKWSYLSGVGKMMDPSVDSRIQCSIARASTRSTSGFYLITLYGLCWVPWHIAILSALHRWPKLLQSLITSPSARLRYAAVTAMKFMISDEKKPVFAVLQQCIDMAPIFAHPFHCFHCCFQESFCRRWPTRTSTFDVSLGGSELCCSNKPALVSGIT